ncbi:monovalent cation/H+ antiporter complex subunit F [Enteractinococcus coprophilus]|uniref:Multicomponent Na+:H+ antiporter subunit F n=1 Tax=Enteractinococcus coprophilus TaxID=1027633 RepID=A0A543AM81_9MICC|nr:monovalent cation/H+ antiporter complex subunit F [Enteractinococcus coprophilus]TQL73693.1 multicomponent Na+:H+ antiporter subunit F [Enteractinococcus coprophilus]
MSVLSLAGWISLGFLALGAIGALYRIVRGPALLDRAIAVDVILIVLSSGLTVWMALNDSTHFIVLVVVASLIGFISSATLARFTVEGAHANQAEPEPQQGPTGGDV